MTPCFLTANHCISTMASANSVLIYWDYVTSTCDGAPPDIDSVPTSSYCTLLSTNSNSDYSLLMVEGSLPDGRFWSGWDSAEPGNSTPVACIHHPTGDYQRISFGNKDASSLSDHIRSNWYSGVTEPGSSGGGLFRQDNQRLTGQLDSGPAVCDGTMLYDDFGSFTVTYSQISSYLACGSDDSFFPNNTCATAAVIGSGDWYGLVVRAQYDDWYSIHVPAGQSVTVMISFTNAWGDLDMTMYNACGGPLVDSSTGVDDSEQVSYQNTGPATDLKVHVYLYSDTRNNYDLHVTVAPIVAVDSQSPPQTLEFQAPAPNPMVSSSRLEFAMPLAGHARLALFDLQGRQVRSLVDANVDAGQHSVSWDARDDDGARVGAGLYWARLEVDGRTLFRRLTVLR
jgi:hypothetical protein